MKDLKCFFKNIFSPDGRFVYGKEPENADLGLIAKKMDLSDPTKGLLPEDAYDELLAQGNTLVEKGKILDPFDIKDPKNLALDQIRKMDKEKIGGLFLTEKKEDGSCVVDFKGNNQAEMAIGLNNLFDENCPILLVEKTDGKKIYGERRKNGLYYEPGTNKRVSIFSGDKITTPVDDGQRALFIVESNRAKKENQLIAKREVNKREEIASEKLTTAKEKLTAHIDNMPDVQWQGGQKEKLLSSLLKYKPDIDPKEDDELIFSVFRYIMRNPELSEPQLVAMATYADMPEDKQQVLVESLRKDGHRIGVTNEKVVNMMVSLMSYYKRNPVMSSEQLQTAVKYVGLPEADQDKLIAAIKAKGITDGADQIDMVEKILSHEQKEFKPDQLAMLIDYIRQKENADGKKGSASGEQIAMNK